MTPHGRATRRTVLRLAATATTAATVAACSHQPLPTQVAVVWSSDELQRFREVLDGYDRQVQVISAGDDIDAFLRARHLAGTSPDVAILPRPGLVTEYAQRGWLTELDDALATRFPVNLGDLLRVQGRLYGVWVKAAHKSLLWHLPSLVPQPLRTWDELVSRTHELAAEANGAERPAPLSIGAADGWVLTDWFENVLAAVTREEDGTYEALARGWADWQSKPVRDALDLLAGLWSIDGAFPGGGRRALLTQHEESVIQVVARRRAAMVFGADFVDAVAERFGRGREQLEWSRFPTVRGGAGPLVVGGDAAVVLGGSARGADLVRWLTGERSFQPWLDAGGYLSPNLTVPPDRYQDTLRGQLAAEIRSAGVLRFDLSDRLPGVFTGSDGMGIWRIMQDFFADVTHGRVPGAVDRATRQLALAARQAAGRP
ncbi:extracellular solute-binding protein [Micromonospora sp. NPDC049679]|uniref:extracellular solute-binding protein n=1 Tax=Micromonospora sp. NPDC049679 TaxID=3155920 RepID=UPI0033F55F19